MAEKTLVFVGTLTDVHSLGAAELLVAVETHVAENVLDFLYKK